MNILSVEASGDQFQQHQNLQQPQCEFNETDEIDYFLVPDYSLPSSGFTSGISSGAMSRVTSRMSSPMILSSFVSLADESNYIMHNDDDNDDDNDDVVVNDSIIPVNPKFIFSVPSLDKLKRNESTSSKLSSSENTTLHSNIKRGTPQDRGCSPPNCIENISSEVNVNNNNPTRSIFGTQTKKKYNVRRADNIESIPMHIHCWASDSTELVIAGDEYPPVISQSNKYTNISSPLLQAVGHNIISQPQHDIYLSPLTPLQAQSGFVSPNRNNRRLPFFPEEDECGQECIPTKQNADTALHFPAKYDTLVTISETITDEDAMEEIEDCDCTFCSIQ